MPPDELRSWLRTQPFQPFRIHLTDGRSLDVRHPDNALVTARTVSVGVYPGGDNQGAFPAYTEMLSLVHIVSIEPIHQPA